MKYVFLLALLLPHLAFSQESSFFPRSQRAETARPNANDAMISASEAMSLASAQVPGGQPLSARLIQNGSSSYYSVKVLREGRVIFINVSASR